MSLNLFTSILTFFARETHSCSSLVIFGCIPTQTLNSYFYYNHSLVTKRYMHFTNTAIAHDSGITRYTCNRKIILITNKRKNKT